VTATYGGSGDYLSSSANASFTIARRAAAVTPAAASKVYGTVDPPLTGTLTGFIATDGIVATYTRAAGESVGTYAISATLTPALALANYTVTYGSALFTISLPAGPGLSVTASPNTLIWSPNKIMTPVTVSGTVSGTGVTLTYAVTDEYKKVQPSGSATVDSSGRYSFVVMLEAYRTGNDDDGRFYTIQETARDQFGRTATASAIVRVPHDQK